MPYLNLIITGWILVFLFGALILLTWWKRKTHLFTFWNAFLVGSTNFIALGMVQNAIGLGEGAIAGSEEFARESWHLIFGTLVFYGAATIVYYRNYAAPINNPCPRCWPLDSRLAITLTSIALVIVSLGFTFAPAFEGAQLLYSTRNAVITAAVLLTVTLVIRYPKSPISYVLFAGVFLAALAVILSRGGGRRGLLSVLAAIPFGAYWLHFKSRPRTRTLVWLGAVAFIGLFVLSSYATIRHTSRDDKLSTNLAKERLTQLPTALIDNFRDLSFLGEHNSLFDTQDGPYVAMRTIQLLNTAPDFEVQWLHCIFYTAVNPIPRAFFPSKPIALGKLVPEYLGDFYTNLGPTVIGHGFYDGGYLVLLFYGLLTGLSCRWMDRRMLLDPDNPWRLAAMVSVIGHVIAFSRGDCGVLLINIVGGIIVVNLLIFSCRFFAPPRHPS